MRNEIIKEVIRCSQKMAVEESCQNEKELEGYTAYKAGIARRWRMKKKKVGKKATKWQNNVKRSNIWKK